MRFHIQHSITFSGLKGEFSLGEICYQLWELLGKPVEMRLRIDDTKYGRINLEDDADGLLDDVRRLTFTGREELEADYIFDEDLNKRDRIKWLFKRRLNKLRGRKK